MAQQKVYFRRKRDDGITVNCWIYPPTGTRKKLRFTNDEAEADLDPGIQYRLYWIAHGPVGGELSIERKVGAGGAFSPIVTDWALPADPNIPAGWPVAFGSFRPFTI